MRRILITASFFVLVFAKPEMYKEKEDFQFSRSSSDEGSKSGYYGAQRGNMGGNYEKAHNMDTLAQHQLSSVVGQVDGELGEGANTRTGSVYTAGNSRGIYGFGHYDLSNLRGRNFAEGSSYDDSLSHSLLSQTSGNMGYRSHSAANNARYGNSQSQSSAIGSDYQTSGLTSQYVQTEDQQAADRYQGSSNYEHGSQSGKSYKYSSHSGSQARTEYGQNSANLNSANGYGYNTGSRLMYTTPVRIYGRPGTRVAIPVSAHTYDASQSSLIHDQNARSSDSELLGYNGLRDNNYPINNGKHYESAYSYRKEWEKHDTQPVTLSSTENPFPKNSELFEDAQATLTASNLYEGKTDSANSHSSNTNSAYQTEYSDNMKSASSSESKYESQQQQRSGASASSNSYSHSRGASASLYGSQISDAAANSNNLVESIGSKPKSYHNSYSYHKSWERRGDPYVIKPAGDVNNEASQRLTAMNSNSYLCSYCVDDGQQRVRRSYNSDQYEQSPNIFNTQEEGQQSPNGWDNGLEQQADSKWDQLQDLDKQTQNKWDNFEDLGQQTQNQWGNLEDLGQQTQSQWGKFDELGQQTQNQWTKLEDLGQQTQNQWSKLNDLGQQPQREWDNSQYLHQAEHNKEVEDFDQQMSNQHDKSGDVVQQIQDQWSKLEDLGQKTHNQWDKLEDLGQQTQNQWGKFVDLGQQQYNQWSKLDESGQQTYPQWNQLNNLNQQESKIEQQPQLGIVTDLGQQVQSSWNLGQFHQIHQHDFMDSTDNYSFQNNWDQQTNSGNILYHNQDAYNPWNSYGSFVPHPSTYPEIPKGQNSLDNKQQVLWDKINNAFKEDEVSNSFNYHDVNPQLTTDKNLNESSFDTWDFLFNPNLNISTKSEEDTVANTQTVQKDKNDINTHIKVQDTSRNMSETVMVQGKELTNVTAHSVDMGRGDIGPEDISIDSSYTLKEKSPEELETLSLSKELNNQKQSKTKEEPLVLNVVGVNQSKEFINKEINSNNLTTILESITTTKKPNTLDNNDKKSTSSKEETLTNSKKVNTLPLYNDKIYPIIENDYNERLNQQNIAEPQGNSQYQQDKTLEQHDMSQYIESLKEKMTRQHVETIDEQHEEGQNFEQQNTDQQLENFEQQNFDKDLETFEQQNTGLLETFDEQRLRQQSENLEQQNLGQQLESLEQQNWGQHSKPLDSTSTDQLETFQQHNILPVENFEPQEIGHVDTFNKESASFEQHSLDGSHLTTGQQSQKPINDNNLQFSHASLGQYEQIIPNQYAKEQNDEQGKKIEQALLNTQKDISTPVEPTTNKPGFWSSVWNKTKSAKDSVVSWFHN